MKQNDNQQAFLSLLGAGLWEKDVQLSQFVDIDFDEIYRLAEEQSVIGIIAAGLEHVVDVKVPQINFLTFIGRAVQLEQKNVAMNDFIAKLVTELNEHEIQALLVKGQGVAQCYERPSWRASGDVDLLLDDENFQKAKDLLTPKATNIHEENPFDKHYSFELDGWVVELHGTLRSLLTKQSDDYIDAVQNEAFRKGRKRIWCHNSVNIPLPNVDDDIIFVFTHILKHFFHYGIGIRQVCDWCRLLWTYKDTIDRKLLESRLQTMGLMTEWKVFGSIAVNLLGMPSEAMPFYSDSKSYQRKADRALAFIMETGNFGHNRDNSYYDNSNAIVRGIRSLLRHTGDSIRHSFIFPIDSMRIWGRMVKLGVEDFFRK